MDGAGSDGSADITCLVLNAEGWTFLDEHREILPRGEGRGKALRPWTHIRVFQAVQREARTRIELVYTALQAAA